MPATLTTRPAQTYRFDDDGRVPNNRDLPLLLYRAVADLRTEGDPAAFFEDLFHANGWGRDWRAGIYPYEHYHSGVHEVLGVASGHASVRFGGRSGETLTLKPGDVAILPAGTGHECLEASGDFLVVGAYPPDGAYDECRSEAANHDDALARIARATLPQTDPVYGPNGEVLKLWRKTTR